MRQGQYLKIFLTGLTLTLSSFAFAQQQQMQPQQQGIQVQDQQQQSYQQPPSGFDPSMLAGSWKSVCAPQGSFGPSNLVPNGGNSQDIEYTFTQDGYGNPEIIFQVNDYNEPTCTSIPVATNTSKTGNYTFQGSNYVFNTVGRIVITWLNCAGMGCQLYDPNLSPYAASVQYVLFVNGALNFAYITPGGGIQPLFRSPLFRPNMQPAGRH